MIVLLLAVAFAAGWFVWTAGEYHLHRFAMHHMKGHGIMSREHLIHHADLMKLDAAKDAMSYAGVVVVGSAMGVIVSLFAPVVVAVSFSLRRGASHPTITRKVVEYGNRYWHVANVREPSQVDADLLDLLTEAYNDEPT